MERQDEHIKGGWREQKTQRGWNFQKTMMKIKQWTSDHELRIKFYLCILTNVYAMELLASQSTQAALDTNIRNFKIFNKVYINIQDSRNASAH